MYLLYRVFCFEILPESDQMAEQNMRSSNIGIEIGRTAFADHLQAKADPGAKHAATASWVANKRFEISKFKFKIPRARTSELQGSFSAVSKPNFASKYSLESSRRDLHNALLCTVL